jgi:hypothetical protein
MLDGGEWRAAASGRTEEICLDALAAFDVAVAADRSWRRGAPAREVRPVEGGVMYEIEES